MTQNPVYIIPLDKVHSRIFVFTVYNHMTTPNHGGCRADAVSRVQFIAPRKRWTDD